MATIDRPRFVGALSSHGHPTKPALSLIGVMLLVVGTLTAVGSFAIDTSVSAGLSGSEVNNLDLLQRQLMIMHSGWAMAIAGSIFVVGAQIVELMALVENRRIQDLEYAEINGAAEK